MGCYEILPKGSQVKCWECKMQCKNLGDQVPSVDGERSYYVILREGGYVKVVDNHITEIVEENELRVYIPELTHVSQLPAFDKYGNRVTRKVNPIDLPFGGTEEYYLF